MTAVAIARGALSEDEMSARERPLVSVVIPVANGARYIAEAIQSVQSQTLSNWELVVVDDASEDATPQIVRSIPDPRIRLIQLSARLGVAGALNVGLESARADFVARLDADDLCRPDRFERLLRELTNRPSLGCIGSWATLIDADGRVIGQRRAPVGERRLQRSLRWHNVIIHPSVMFRRDLVIACGSYRSDAVPYEDYDLWLRLAAVAKLDNLSLPLLAYRLHANQVTRGNVLKCGGINDVATSRRKLASAHRESYQAARVRQLIWVTTIARRELLNRLHA